ncbi:dihydrolipoyl dehydrogenase family protein [Lichenicoccus sp.]|uniref:dihydrolipoyl dehydrogenase family protein n=1 Tax=Lichenicoccus sp. TaxID=2781899 RepID=UPI003D0FC143
MARTHDVIVIGAGSAGLTAAGGCARLGLRVALIERDRMGGECLNTGCVPSKALLAAAPDFAAARVNMRRAIETIAPHDSAERFAAWGVEVIRGHAALAGPRSVAVGGHILEAPRIVLAVGSNPVLPPIEGLAQAPYLTNETLFELTDLPAHLLVIGGGPIGIELAQAFRRLGAKVTVIEADRALAREEPEAAAVILGVLRAQGVVVREQTSVQRVATGPDGIQLALETGETLIGSHLLVAAGRSPNLDGLRLDLAGVRTQEGAITVDRRCRTSNRRIFAIGDCGDGPKFTHAAGHAGSIVVMNIGFGLPARTRFALMPSVTYTKPELARIGVTEQQARASRHDVRTITQPFADNDRAVIEGETEGFAKLVRAGRKIAGVTIVGAGAGELLLPWSLAMGGRASLWALSGATIAYPTRSEITKALAFAAYEPAIFGRWARRWAKLLSRMRR